MIIKIIRMTIPKKMNSPTESPREAYIIIECKLLSFSVVVETTSVEVVSLGGVKVVVASVTGLVAVPVIAIVGSSLEVNGTSIFDSTAKLGGVVSACNSNVTITNPEVSASQDATYSFCSLYNSSNTTRGISTTTEQITPTTPPLLVALLKPKVP